MTSHLTHLECTELARRPWNLWRYAGILPVQEPANRARRHEGLWGGRGNYSASRNGCLVGLPSLSRPHGLCAKLRAETSSATLQGNVWCDPGDCQCFRDSL
jgi:hypothetical protein